MVDLTRIIDKLPAIIPRESDSVIARYIEAFQDDTDEFADDLENIRDSRFIDQATGAELDQIGRQYGPLGSRAGRDDQEYRTYLKSLVQAFQYRGTVPGIKAAVAAGLGVEEEDVTVYEHFNDDPASTEEYLEYTITLSEWGPHRGSTVEELAELSDASVSRLRKTRYDDFDEDATIADAVQLIEGVQYSDDFTSDDATDSNRRAATDDLTVDDAEFINQNQNTYAEDATIDDATDSNNRAVTDDLTADDAEFVNQNQNTYADDVSADDALADTQEQFVEWDSTSWDNMYWATEHN